MSAVSELRPSPIAGMWYEGRPKQLADEVDEYLDKAALPELDGEVIGVITPHAGHRYSGNVAGHAFAAIRRQSFELVTVIAPMHHPYAAPLITTAHAAYATPLGPLPVDRQAIQMLDEALRPRLGFGLTAVANDPEHSLEIELPFLQRALTGDFKLLPVMVRAQEASISRALGEALAGALKGRKTLLVASTDLSHFYPQTTARKLDEEMLQRIESFAPEQIFAAEDEGKGFACGHAAVAAVLWAALAMGADHITRLAYATSGDVTGDLSSVVGYGALAILKRKK
jgi:AmmeMemoRadiSam system protein B